MNHFMEIAKMRAARMFWAKIVKAIQPKKSKIDGFADPLPNFGLEFNRTRSI